MEPELSLDVSLFKGHLRARRNSRNPFCVPRSDSDSTHTPKHTPRREHENTERDQCDEVVRGRLELELGRKTLVLCAPLPPQGTCPRDSRMLALQNPGSQPVRLSCLHPQAFTLIGLEPWFTRWDTPMQGEGPLWSLIISAMGLAGSPAKYKVSAQCPEPSKLPIGGSDWGLALTHSLVPS